MNPGFLGMGPMQSESLGGKMVHVKSKKGRKEGVDEKRSRILNPLYVMLLELGTPTLQKPFSQPSLFTQIRWEKCLHFQRTLHMMG